MKIPHVCHYSQAHGNTTKQIAASQWRIAFKISGYTVTELSIPVSVHFLEQYKHTY